jgi:hypothetical protein
MTGVTVGAVEAGGMETTLLAVVSIEKSTGSPAVRAPVAVVQVTALPTRQSLELHNSPGVPVPVLAEMILDGSLKVQPE